MRLKHTEITADDGGSPLWERSCVLCRHSVETQCGSVCRRHVERVSPVIGTVTFSKCSDQRGFGWLVTRVFGLCGSEGRHFEDNSVERKLREL